MINSIFTMYTGEYRQRLASAASKARGCLLIRLPEFVFIAGFKYQVQHASPCVNQWRQSAILHDSFFRREERKRNEVPTALFH